MSTRIFFRSTCRRLHLLFLLLAAAITCADVRSEEAQLLMSATYEGKISGWDVELERTLTQYPDGRYLLRSYASKVFAYIEETSLFTLENGRAVPLEYRYKRSILGRKSIEKIVYDWQNMVAQYTRSDRSRNNTEHKLTAGLLDPALYQLAVQADLAKNHEGLHYRFIKRKQVEHYDLVAKTNETVTVAGKKFEAAVVFRDDPESDKSTKVWVIPELHHMIAKIRHVDKDGDEFEINLKHYAVAEEALRRFYQAFSNNGNADSGSNHNESKGQSQR